MIDPVFHVTAPLGQDHLEGQRPPSGVFTRYSMTTRCSELVAVGGGHHPLGDPLHDDRAPSSAEPSIWSSDLPGDRVGESSRVVRLPQCYDIATFPQHGAPVGKIMQVPRPHSIFRFRPGSPGSHLRDRCAISANMAQFDSQRRAVRAQALLRCCDFFRRGLSFLDLHPDCENRDRSPRSANHGPQAHQCTVHAQIPRSAEPFIRAHIHSESAHPEGHEVRQDEDLLPSLEFAP